MRRSLALLPALLIAGLPMFLGLAAAPAVAAPAPVAVAVVDLLELINAYPGFRQAKDTLEARVKQAEAELDRAKADIKSLEADLSLKHSANAPTRPAAEKVLASKKMTSEFDWKWNVKVAQDEFMGTLIRAHATVKGLIAQYARDNGIGLVLQMTKEEVTGKSPDELIPNIVVRTVAYFDVNIDITEKVKSQFPAGPPMPPAGPVAPPPVR